MVVGPCPTSNMTGPEVTETYGLFDKTDNLDGRVANSNDSEFANQKEAVIVQHSGWWLSSCCLEIPGQGMENLVNLNAQVVGTSWY